MKECGRDFLRQPKPCRGMCSILVRQRVAGLIMHMMGIMFWCSLARAEGAHTDVSLVYTFLVMNF